MALARSSLAQQKFFDKYKQIAAERDRYIGLAVSLDFISVLSTSLAVIDMAPIFGFPIAVFITLSWPTFIFYGLILGAVVCGIFCATDIVAEGEYRKNIELNLMIECFNLKTDRYRKEEKLKNLLAKFLKIHDAEFLRTRYQKLLDHTATNNTIREINGYLKALKQKLSPSQKEEPEERFPKLPLIRITPPNYAKRTLIAFFTGAGFMLGIVSTIIGATPLCGLLFTPAGLGIIAAALLVCAAVGVASAWYDYRTRNSQQKHTEQLEDKKFSRTLRNKRLDKVTQSLDDTLRLLSADVTHTRSSQLEPDVAWTRSLCPGTEMNAAPEFDTPSLSPQ